MSERRRFLDKPPEHLKDDDPELYNFLANLQERISDMFGDAESKIPATKFQDVKAKSRGAGREIIVPHDLGTNPTAFTLIDKPRNPGGSPFTFEKSRETIGSRDTAYFESDAPSGKVFLVRLEAR